MMEAVNADDLNEDDPEEAYVKRTWALARMIPILLDYNMVTVQVVTEGPFERPTAALVVHNPFDVMQYRIIAFLPDFDSEAAHLSTSDQIAENMRDVLAEDEHGLRTEALEKVANKRIMLAVARDHDFADKINEAHTFEDAKSIYMTHYGLENGGDFNRPLE
jgi:hypothetical protein